MKILRRYEMESAWYAQVVTDDGRVLDLKCRPKADEEPTDAEWFELAAAVEVPDGSDN